MQAEPRRVAWCQDLAAHGLSQLSFDEVRRLAWLSLACERVYSRIATRCSLTQPAPPGRA